MCLSCNQNLAIVLTVIGKLGGGRASCHKRAREPPFAERANGSIFAHRRSFVSEKNSLGFSSAFVI